MTKAHIQLACAAWLCLLSGNAEAQSYGETQIGYPQLRASTTLPAPIPARSIVPRQPLRSLPSTQQPTTKAEPMRNVGSLSRGYATAGAAVARPAVASPQRTLRKKTKTPKSSAVYPLRHLQPDLWAGIKPASKRVRSPLTNLRIRKSVRSVDKNRVQANLKGIAIDGMSSINYQRILDRQIAVGAGAQHFQYQTPQAGGEEQGSGVGGELFARYKPFRNLSYHEGIFVSMGLGAMAMNWQQQVGGLGGAVTVSDQEGVYGTVSSGVSYQTAVYGSVLIEPRLDYILFAPIESDSSKLVHRFEPTVAFGFGF